MKALKARLLTQTKQAVSDLDLLYDANLKPSLMMPVANAMASLRLLQEVCMESGASIYEVTPQDIIKKFKRDCQFTGNA